MSNLKNNKEKEFYCYEYLEENLTPCLKQCVICKSVNNKLNNL